MACVACLAIHRPTYHAHTDRKGRSFLPFLPIRSGRVAKKSRANASWHSNVSTSTQTPPINDWQTFPTYGTVLVGGPSLYLISVALPVAPSCTAPYGSAGEKEQGKGGYARRGIVPGKESSAMKLLKSKKKKRAE